MADIRSVGPKDRVQQGVGAFNAEIPLPQDEGILDDKRTAYEQAEMYGHSLQREVAFLTVHSMLHLLGYDHEGGGLESVRMREKEETVLTQLGLQRNGSYYMGE